MLYFCPLEMAQWWCMPPNNFVDVLARFSPFAVHLKNVDISTTAVRIVRHVAGKVPSFEEEQAAVIVADMATLGATLHSGEIDLKKGLVFVLVTPQPLKPSPFVGKLPVEAPITAYVRYNTPDGILFQPWYDW